MSARSAARAGVQAFLAVKLLVLAINLVRFPVVKRGDIAVGHDVSRDVDLSDVSVLIPARDEAGRLPATLPALLAEHHAEVLVLDDNSTDGTAGIAQDIIDRSGHPRARVIQGKELPQGWTGKTWACEQLAAAAAGDTFVFLDCDVTVEPGGLAAVIAEKRRAEADVFSVFPRQDTGSVGEHLVVPTIDAVLLTLLPHFLLRLPIPAAATAHGACLVFDRDSYARAGGFEAVRTQIVEDVAMARHTRALGMRLGLALGGDLIHVRMYQSYGDVVAGLSRGLMPMAGGSKPVLVLGWAAHAAAYTLPLVLVSCDRRWVLPLAMGITERGLVEIKTRRYAVWQAILSPAIAPAMVPLVLRALRGRPTWRGRTYA